MAREPGHGLRILGRVQELAHLELGWHDPFPGGGILRAWSWHSFAKARVMDKRLPARMAIHRLNMAFSQAFFSLAIAMGVGALVALLRARGTQSRPGHPAKEDLRGVLTALRRHRKRTYAPSTHWWRVVPSPLPPGEACEACWGLSDGKETWQCDVCGVIVHRDCADSSDAAQDCKRAALRPEAARGKRKRGRMEHHWVACRGIRLGSCHFCNETGLLGSRDAPPATLICLWCKRTCHGKCLGQALKGQEADCEANECDLGSLKSVAVPPRELVLNKGTVGQSLCRAIWSARAFSQWKRGDGKISPASFRRRGASWGSGFEGTETMPRTPVIAFLNLNGGSEANDSLAASFRQCLNPLQVWRLGVDSSEPETPLAALSVLPNVRALALGGDGTAHWVASASAKHSVPLAALPLGTGNDLARVLGWGRVRLRGHEGPERLRKVLNELWRAEEEWLDRWQLEGKPHHLNLSMLNYFSIGVDAKVALGFHQLRRERPGLFQSQVVNKALYTRFGAPEALLHSCCVLPSSVSLRVDGREVYIPAQTEGLMVLNIGSYMGGVKLWRSELEGQWRVQRHDDGVLEVAAVRGTFHLGRLQLGVGKGAVRLAQGRIVELSTHSELPMQVDGEPWLQKESIRISIRPFDNVPVLRRPSRLIDEEDELWRADEEPLDNAGFKNAKGTAMARGPEGKDAKLLLAVLAGIMCGFMLATFTHATFPSALDSPPGGRAKPQGDVTSKVLLEDSPGVARRRPRTTAEPSAPVSEHLQELKSVLQRVAPGGEVLVAISNKALLSPDGKTGMLRTWLECVWRAGVQRYMVVALDDQIAEALAKLGVPHWRRDPSRLAAKATDNHGISAQKFAILGEFMRLGWSVLLSDVDVAILRDPFPHLHKDSDVEGMSDGYDERTAYGYVDGVDDPSMGWSRYAQTMRIYVTNSGLFYIRATNPSIALVDRCADRLAKRQEWDQTVFNEEMFYPSHGSYVNPGVSKRVMEITKFMNSRYLFRTARRSPSLIARPPVLVHVNYHPDKWSRLRAIASFFFDNKRDALDPFPDGSCWHPPSCKPN